MKLGICTFIAVLISASIPGLGGSNCLGQELEKEVDQLINELKSADDRRKRDICKRLGEIGPEARAATEAVFDVSEIKSDIVIFGFGANRALAKMGGEIIPELRNRIDHDPLQVLTVMKYMIDEDAAPLVPEIIPLLDHPNSEIRVQTGLTLGRFAASSKLVAPALIELFERHEEDDHLVYTAVGSLGVSTPETKAILPQLLHLSRTTRHNHIKDSIVRVVASIDPSSDECLQILLDGSDNDQMLGLWGSVSLSAFVELAGLGADAGPAKEKLLKWLNDNELEEISGRYSFICTVLANVNATEALPTLRKQLAESTEPYFIVNAATAIARLDADADEPIDRLIEILNQRTEPPLFSGGKMPRAYIPEEAAAYSLGLIGPRAAKAIPALREAMKSDDYTLSRRAAWALARIDPDNRECIAVIEESDFSFPEWPESPFFGETPEEVVRVLGDRIDILVPKFIEASFEYENDHEFMIDVLAQDEKHVPALIDHAMKLIADPGVEIYRKDVYRSLTHLGPRAAPGLETLLRYTDAENHFQRAEAARMLGIVGRDAKTVVPKLTELLKDPRVLVRARAATALGRFGLAANSSLPGLQAATKDKYYSVRNSAQLAIDQIQPK